MLQLKKMYVDLHMLHERLLQPLGIDAYLRRVLVPETATHLIQADRQCSRKEALRILKASRKYGVAVCRREEEVEETEDELATSTKATAKAATSAAARLSHSHGR